MMIFLSLILIGYHMVPDPKELPNPRLRTLADPLDSNWPGLFQGLMCWDGLGCWPLLN